MYASGVRTFCEVGPSSQMNGLIKVILEGREAEIVSVDTSGGKRSGETDLARALGQLAASGYNVKIAAWDEYAPIFDENAATSKKQTMTVPISGANYFKPKPSKPAVSRKVVVMPDMSPGAQTSLNIPSSVSLSKETAAGQKTVSLSDRTALQSDKAKTSPLASTSVSSSPASSNQTSRTILSQQPAAATLSVPPKNSTIASLDLSEALRMTQENLRALQLFQQQSADLHRQFLEGQETTRQTFDRLFSQQQNLLLGTFTPSAPQTVSQVEVPFAYASEQSVPQVAQHSQPIAPAAPPVSRPDSTTSEPALVAPLTISESAAMPPVSGTAQAGLSRQVEKILLDVVSEKTGYPVDMLDLEMGLDADLGIDSIKRVEIFSALQEQLPDTSEVSADQIGQIQTLGQIVELLGTSPSMSSTKPNIVASVCTDSPSETSSVDFDQVEKVLLDVVSEKTGYPQEMLDLDMGLDADLGIDSIKRGNLFRLAASIARHTGNQFDQLGQIQNLRQIVDFLSVSVETLPHQKPAKSDSVKSKTGGVDANQVKTVLLQVVSEKPGILKRCWIWIWVWMRTWGLIQLSA